MKNLICMALMIVVMSGRTAPAADLIWDNSDFDFVFLNPNNWDTTPDTPLAGGVGPFMDRRRLADNFTINNFDTVTAGERLTLAGGDISITIDTFSKLDIAGGGLEGDGDPTTTERVILNGAFAELNSQFVSEGVIVDINGGATLTLRGGDVPLSTPSGARVNFDSELSSGMINLTGKTSTDGNFNTSFSGIYVEGNRAVAGGNVNVVDGANGVEITPRDATIYANINRTTGALTLVNEGSSIAFDSYTVSSAAGSLDTTAYTPIVSEGSDAWTVSESLPTLLMESEDPAGDGVTIGGGISFGNVWRLSPYEDLFMNLNLAGGGTQGVVIRYSGAEAVAGDLTGDGEVDLDDWAVFRANLLGNYDETATLVDTYFLGDFDGDRDTDGVDLGTFESYFDAENGPGAFAFAVAGVPEPATVAILASTLLAGAFVRRRQVAACLLVTLIAATLGAESRADITWTGAGTANNLFDDANYDFSGSTVTTIDEFVPVVGNLLYQSGSITGGGYSGFGTVHIDEGFTMTFDAFNLNSTGTTGGLEAQVGGTVDITNGSNLNLQFIQGGTFRIDGTSTLTLRGGGDPINNIIRPIELLMEQGAQLTLVSAAEIDEHNSKIFAANTDGYLVSFSEDSSVLNVVGSTATAVNPNLYGRALDFTIEVNRATGEVMLRNDNIGPLDYTFDFYSIGGSLDFVGWDSLQSQDLTGFMAGDGSGNGWEEAGASDDTELGEVFLLGSSTLAHGDAISLGQIYNVSSLAEDLAFTYRDAVSGSLRSGRVVYIGDVPSVLLGDFNGDNIVNAADYTVWRDNLNSTDESLINNAGDTNGVIDGGDYDVWVANYGATASPSLTVPEPSAVAAVLAAALGLLGASRRRRDS